MTARFAQSWAKASRANLAGAVGFLLALRRLKSQMRSRGRSETARRFLQHVEDFGSPGWIRTSDHSINSRMLYR